MATRPSRGFLRFQWRLHRLTWQVSGGRLGRRVVGLPILELVTTGHKSGEPRSILISYLEGSDGPVIAGTNAGADHDPAWVRNLRARPEARIREAGEWRTVHARFLEGEEWERAWKEFTDHAGYTGYREMTDRPIPLVALESIG